MIYYYKNEFHKDVVSLNVMGPSFKFGLGFFESLLYNGRVICHLDLHLKRVRASMQAFDLEYETVDFEHVIMDVLRKNELETSFCKVNIFYQMDNMDAPASPLVAAVASPRDPEKLFRLTVSSNPLLTHLAGHKCMNYAFYFLEARAAMVKGYDAAVITGPDNEILEASSSALLFSDGERFFSPNSIHALPSTALAVAQKYIPITRTRINVEELSDFCHAYVLNAIVGMRPVVEIDTHAFAPDHGTCVSVSNHIQCA